MAISKDENNNYVLYIWGNGSNYQLGNGRRDNIFKPFINSFAIDKNSSKQVGFIYIAGGNYHTLAIDTENRLWGWGFSKYVGSETDDFEYPKLIDEQNIWKEIVCGDEHSFIIDKNNQLYILGMNNNQKLLTSTKK